MAVCGRADTAYPLRQVPGIPGVSSPQYYFKSPEECPACPGILYPAAFNLHLNPEMSFYPRKRVYGYPCHYLSPPSFSALVLPDARVAIAGAAMPAAAATAAAAPILSAVVSTPAIPGIFTSGSLS